MMTPRESLEKLVADAAIERKIMFMGRQSGKSQFAKTLKKMQQTKVARENEALHKTAAFLADEARRTERAMERGRYRR